MKGSAIMLRLKNVSKFYYSKGIITSGFSKININFDKNEFVVITGESGSGKSTLLNVISGLDGYEEGELYINGNKPGVETKKIVSYLPDNNFLNSWMTIEQIVNYFADFYSSVFVIGAPHIGHLCKLKSK